MIEQLEKELLEKLKVLREKGLQLHQERNAHEKEIERIETEMKHNTERYSGYLDIYKMFNPDADYILMAAETNV